MAGFALMGIDEGGSGILNISAITEYRGHSWAIGGDNGAVTMANFVKRYSSSLQGPSLGHHLAEICNGLFCLDFIRKYHTIWLISAFPTLSTPLSFSLGYPNKDVLNAALSGAIAMNLDNELDYLIRRTFVVSLCDTINPLLDLE